jgi:cysteine desulfurase/selenocysteine lyase
MEIIFTRGTTESINLAAAAWGGEHLKPGDEILLGLAEHASNMVPWQLIARRTGASVRWFGISDDGRPLLDEMRRAVGPRTRMVAFSHVSNVLGHINPVREMCDIARRGGAKPVVLVDGAQSVPHMPVDVTALGCDFLAFSGHKMMGPMGSGVLWGRRELLDAMAPYQGGSNMAHAVDLDGLELSDGAMKFGAGSPNVAGAVGLAAAADFIGRLSWEAIVAHERALSAYALDALRGVPALRLLGPASPEDRIGVFAFTLDGRSVPEIVKGLDARGVMVRGGDLASLPLLKRLGTTTAARASCYLYTTTGDIDRLVAALRELARGGRSG